VPWENVKVERKTLKPAFGKCKGRKKNPKTLLHPENQV
jgi:hypothetical protein